MTDQKYGSVHSSSLPPSLGPPPFVVPVEGVRMGDWRSGSSRRSFHGLPLTPPSLHHRETNRSQGLELADDDWSDSSSSSGDDYEDDTPRAERSAGDQERLGWQAMLSSVLHGDVFKGEKRREQANIQAAEWGDQDGRLWLSLRARLHGCTIELEQEELALQRIEHVHSAIERVLNFRVDPPFSDPMKSKHQADQVIFALLSVKSLYPNTAAFYRDNPLATGSDFIERRDALYTWTNIIAAFRQQMDLFVKWVGQEVQEELRGEGPISSNTLAPFRDLLLKDEATLNIFYHSSLSTIPRLIRDAKDAQSKYYHFFQDMGLPSFENEAVSLLRFSLCMASELISIQVENIGPFLTSQVLSIVEQSRQLLTSVGFACAMKDQCVILARSTADGSWGMHQFIDSEFDTTVLQAGKGLITLTLQNLRRFRKDWFFVETEVLENDLLLTRDISRIIYGGTKFIGEELGALAEESISYAAHILRQRSRMPMLSSVSENDPAPLPSECGAMTQRDIIAWYQKLLDSSRLRSRKLLTHATNFVNAISDSAEFEVSDMVCQQLADILAEDGYLLLQSESFDALGLYILVPSQLRDKPQLLAHIIKGEHRFLDWPQLMHTTDPSTIHAHHILAWSSSTPITWSGEVLYLHTSLTPFKIRLGRLRLITNCSGRGLNLIKERVTNLIMSTWTQDEDRETIPSIVCCVQRRAHLQSVNKQLRKLTQAASELVQSIVETAISVWERLRETASAHSLIEFWFSFAAQETRIARQQTHQLVMPHRSVLVSKMALAWATFIADDCDTTRRQRFTWIVHALEFSKQLGNDLFGLSVEEFHQLRGKVGKCVSLLIRHYDVLGGSVSQQRSLRIAEAQGTFDNQEDVVSPRPTHENVQEASMRAIVILEERRDRLARESQLLGRVLNRDVPDDRGISMLASFASNISMRWEQGHLLGEGSFGAVYMALDLETGSVMAVKEVRLSAPTANTEIHSRIRNEINVLEMVRHPNIVQYHGIEVHRNVIYLFQEYLGGGSLDLLLREGPFEELISQMYTMQMLEGLKYLHENGIVHRDIKPNNLMLSSDGTIKFVDFGSATVSDPRFAQPNGTATPSESDFVGTPMYISPEVVKREYGGLLGARDIWAIGCVVLELLTGRKPWTGFENEWAIMFHVASTNEPPLLPESHECSPAAIDFVSECLQLDVARRPSAQGLLQHQWMQACREVLAQYSGTD